MTAQNRARREQLAPSLQRRPAQQPTANPMKPVRNALLILFFFGAVMNSAAAAPVDELRVGVVAQGAGPVAPSKEQGVGINLEALFRSPDFLAVVGSPRPHIGASIAADSEATSQIYAGLEWRAILANRFILAAAAGGAVHNGETARFDPILDASRRTNTQFLGCRALFRVGLDAGVRVTERLSLLAHWDHISNAGLCDENEGLDNAGLRLGLTF